MHPLAAVAVLLFPPLLAAQAPASRPARLLPYPIDLPAAFQQAIAAGTRTAEGRPGPNHWTNYALYDLSIDVDPLLARVTGRARMTYLNRSPSTLRELVVLLYHDMLRPGQQRTRTVATTDGLELIEVRLAGERVRARPRDTRLLLRLAEPLVPGARAEVEIDYAFTIPPAGTAPRTGHEDDRVIFLGYWYPQFAVYDDVEGWVADPYRGNGEFYMGYADYDLAITVPAGYLVRATGVLQNGHEVLTSKALDALDRARQGRDVVPVIDQADHDAGTVTAPAANGRHTWRYRAENVRDAAVSIARTYLWDATHAVVADKHGPGQHGIAEIHAVYEPDSGDWVRAALYARHTIEYMSQRVHPYPWPQMTACEGVISGGMEFPMMTIIGGRRPAETIAHELIHMWFPMLVGTNEKRHAWQDEGLTSFWTTLCRDDFTSSSNGPRRDVMLYGNIVRRGGDAVAMRHADTYGEDNFVFAAYSKPAAVLHQLRALLGDETFFAAFRRYTADWAWKHPYPYDLFHTFTDVAGVDLQPYFRTWFYETWQLDHAIAAVEPGDARSIVRIEDRGRAVHPCTVEATLADGTVVRQTVPAAAFWLGTEAVVEFAGRVVEVQIDPDVATLDVDRRNNRWSAD